MVKKSYIQLDNFEKGLFGSSFIDYCGKKQTLNIQQCYSNFTKEGLLEVTVHKQEGDSVVIQVCHEIFPYIYKIESKDLIEIDKSPLLKR